MNNEVIKVNLFDEVLGFLSLQQQKIIFQYDDNFLKKKINPAPITMSIDKGDALYSFPNLSKDTFKGLPGLIADSIPDRFGRRLIKEKFKRIKLDNPNPLDYLSHIGNKTIGALSFESDIINKEQKTVVNQVLNIESLVENALKAFSDNIAEVNDDFIYMGSFIGGARAKALLDFSPKNKTLSLNKNPSYLIKFDGITAEDSLDPQGYGRIEYAYYLMAKKIGIEIMPSFLLEENDRAHFITQRFDIIKGKKQHIQTFGAMAHLDFHTPQTASYADYFAIIVGLNMPYTERLEGFRRMLFNVIGKNYDDHVKNFSFMMDEEGQWRLTPAYDLVYAHNNHNPAAWTRSHNMTINNKGNDINYEDILIEAQILELKQNDIQEILEKITGVFSFWIHYAQQAKVNLKRQKFIFEQINESIDCIKIGVIK